MFSFLAENLATILISAVLLAVVALIAVGLIRKRKSGKSVGCSCGCADCPSASMCHTADSEGKR